MKHTIKIALALLTLIFFATTNSNLIGENKQPKPKPPTWHFKFKPAMGVTKSKKRPMLVFVSTRYDTPSWEVECAVIKTQRFIAQARKFTLCQAEPRDKDFQKAAPTGSRYVGGLVFFDSVGNKIETTKWDGHPEKMLEVIERVAAGNSIAQLEAKASAAGGDLEALKTLYKIYSEKPEPDKALATLQKILAAAPEQKKHYKGDEQYWDVVKKASSMKPADAIKQIKAAIGKVKSQDKKEALLVLLARARFNAGDRKTGLTAIAKFIKKYPKSKWLEMAYENIFAMLMFAQDKNHAIKCGITLLSKFPHNRIALNYLNRIASQYYGKGEYKKAENVYHLLAQASPVSAIGAISDFMYRAMTKGTAMKNRAGTLRATKNVLYIVPDTVTCLAYISEWDAQWFFPVMIDRGTSLDKRLITKFVNDFQPARIIRVTKRVKQALTEDFVRKAVLASFDERRWSDVKKAGPEEFKALYTSKKLSPVGIVLADIKSPGLLAGGAALAAGHGQLIDFYSSGMKSESTIKHEDAEKIRHDIIGKIAAWGYAYDAAFDDIDFVTLACKIPLQFTNIDFRKYCTDDFIARHDNNIRYAYFGRLMGGTTTTSEYMAMCSLFLKPQNALFFDAYKGRSYSHYASEKAAEQLKATRLMTVQYLGGKDAVLEKWRAINNKGNTYNMIFINSAGGPSDWITANDKATTADVPGESIPAIIHMTHSFSAANPYSIKTIAGKWISAGAYIYYGSTYEPFLSAFRMPREYITSILEKEPLGMAFRRRVGRPFWRTWRLVYIGDPLNTPAIRATRRLSFIGKLRDGETNIRDIEKLFPKKNSK